jgi:hypothetical protein
VNSSWKVILATIVIFGAGVFTGGFLVNQVQHPRRARQLPPIASSTNSITNTNATDIAFADLPGPLRAEILNRQFVGQLSNRLDLTPEQSEKIQKIIAQAQQNSRDLWKLAAPQFQVLWRDTRQQIRDTLTPEQRKQFEQLLKQHTPHRLPSTNAPVIPPPLMPPATTNGPAV